MSILRILVISLFTASLCLTGKPTMHMSEFLLILRPSSLGGVGVFAVDDIPAGTILLDRQFKTRVLKTKDIPADFVKYCIHITDEICLAPEQFDRLEIGWFVNHSPTPNIAHRVAVNNPDLVNGVKVYGVYAIRDIKAGEEILIDYNSLNEPEHLKENYYIKNVNQ